MPAQLVFRFWLVAMLLLGTLLGSSADAGESVLRVKGTSIEMADASGNLRSGLQLAGSSLQVGEGAGAAVLRIVAVVEDAVPGVLLHEIEILNATGTWTNICEPDRDQRRLALFIAGYDVADGSQVRAPERVSLTCSAGVQGKCLRAGYLPWDDSRGPGTGQELFQTCTRMFRADYCGDGIGWTRNGMAIDLFDRANIQRPAMPATMPFEAAWGPKGAVCVHHTRVSSRGDLDTLLRACPRLAQVPNGAACTEALTADMPGALLFNRSVVGAN
jgi:hypothetical protein